jgi:hypothetical protein
MCANGSKFSICSTVIVEDLFLGFIVWTSGCLPSAISRQPAHFSHGLPSEIFAVQRLGEDARG